MVPIVFTRRDEAIDVSLAQIQAQPVSSGHLALVALPPSQFQSLLGKPAFYDYKRGLFFDGQQAYLYVPQSPPIQQNQLATAINVGAPSSQALGAGFGSRVPLMPEKQQFYKGKPAFYDPVHQVHYDGNQAYLFVPLNEPTTAIDIRGPANQANQLSTAVYFSEGFGQRVPVPEDVAVHLNAQYQGKPAFFDSSKGLFYDGQGQLYLYQPDNSLRTAIESSASQQNPLGVGNFSLYL
ncbi:hypothetical protein DdX_17830 [Ditylenchus destructor]|uniref:Uncharacterized protein n=1 Tax=Ditylenchus destructor TaxID=166010 RepID=A0AAD4QYU0_9BILA|nr:hypothetical protein DdX_17830 [Ditylenchus destructor]